MTYGDQSWAIRLLPFAAAVCRSLTLKRQVAHRYGGRNGGSSDAVSTLRRQ